MQVINFISVTHKNMQVYPHRATNNLWEALLEDAKELPKVIVLAQTCPLT